MGINIPNRTLISRFIGYTIIELTSDFFITESVMVLTALRAL